MANNKTFSESGLFTVLNVNGGIYDNVTLDASNSGSIHVMKELTVNETLTIRVSNSATILMPKKVTCKKLSIEVTHSSYLVANDLEVLGMPSTNPVTIDVNYASNAVLFMVLGGTDVSGKDYGGQVAGGISYASTLILNYDVQNSASLTDTISTAHASTYTKNSWKGPSTTNATVLQREASLEK